MKVLLEIMLTLLVVDVFPSKSTAYAFTMFVPNTKGNVTDQFVQMFVVVAGFQVPPFN